MVPLCAVVRMLGCDGVQHGPLCAGCGEPIGVYEPLWVITREAGAELSSWLQLRASTTVAVALWHASCAEGDGIPGG